jgi:hypothetical protein
LPFKVNLHLYNAGEVVVAAGDSGESMLGRVVCSFERRPLVRPTRMNQ